MTLSIDTQFEELVRNVLGFQFSDKSAKNYLCTDVVRTTSDHTIVENGNRYCRSVWPSTKVNVGLLLLQKIAVVHGPKQCSYRQIQEEC